MPMIPREMASRSATRSHLLFPMACLASVLTFAACETGSTDGSHAHTVEIRGEAQGTTYSVKYIDSVNVEPAEIDSILLEIDHSLSAWDDASVLSAFNRSDTITIRDSLFLRAFWLGRAISGRTSGAFHPMIMPLVRAWGFGPEGGQLKEGANLDSLMALVTFDFTAHPLSNDSSIGPVYFSKPQGVQLDVNAYVPGYSVDLVSGYLISKGVKNFMVEIGGEIYARGHNENGENWRIGVDKPVPLDEPRSLEAIVSLHDAALATSGSYRKFYEVDGKKYSHTIDPRTGRPVEHHLLSATIMTKTCIDADAYATAFMVLGVEGSKKFMEEHPELGLEAYLIYDDGDHIATYATSGMRSIIEELD